MTNSLPKVLITGSKGQLGSALNFHPLAKAFHLIPYSREELDITETHVLEDVIRFHHPDFIINTAAYTAVDRAEQEKEIALQINYESVKALAILCEKYRLPLCHLSTDYVFDGTKKLPYTETDASAPLNVYGESKWLGEEAIRMHSEQHIILRVSGIFSPYGNNFLKTILKLAQTKKELSIVADQITCPTNALDIAHALYTIAECLLNSKSKHFGTYHYCSTPAISWYQFAAHVIGKVKSHQSIILEKINAISAKDYASHAKRPAYSVLDCTKIANDFALMQPSFQEHLSGVIHDCLYTP